MTNSSLNADELHRGLESLPAELYIQIYNDVFTAAGGVRHLDDNKAVAESTNLLQVSRSTRAQYGTSYFAPGCEFLVDRTDWECIAKWFASLAKEHRDNIGKLILVSSVPYAMDPIRESFKRPHKSLGAADTKKLVLKSG